MNEEEETMEMQNEHKHVDDQNEIEVQVSTVGEVVGSDKDGNPVPQTITEESLARIASGLNERNEEVLVDVDHQSARTGLDRDTKAVGWLSRFWTTAKGLFARLKLTPMGREMVEGREYRKLSPVFALGEDGTPVSLESAAFTNTPAMTDIEPILNQKPTTNEKENKEDVEDAKEASDEGAGTASQPAVDVPNGDPEVKADEVKTEEPSEGAEQVSKDEEKKDTWDNPEELVSMWKQNCDSLQQTVSELKTQLETIQNECAQLKDERDAAVNECSAMKDSAKKGASKASKETIKESSLNMMPTTASMADRPWGDLKGDALLRWARGHL